MVIDRIVVLESLAQHEVRVARSKYVDSAEDVLAFAARRNAKDPRILPIRLYGAFPGVALNCTPAFSEAPFTDAQAIQDAYRRLAPKVAAAGGRVLAQIAIERGSDLAIECHVDAALGKIIVLRSATHSVQRMVPLDTAGAAYLAANFQGHEHHGSREQNRRMLEHLLIRVSGFFEECGAERLELDPVRLHEHAYTVLDAIVASQHPMHVKHVEAGGRDRKGHYHPSGQQ